MKILQYLKEQDVHPFLLELMEKENMLNYHCVGVSKNIIFLIRFYYFPF